MFNYIKTEYTPNFENDFEEFKHHKPHDAYKLLEWNDNQEEKFHIHQLNKQNLSALITLSRKEDL